MYIHCIYLEYKLYTLMSIYYVYVKYIPGISRAVSARFFSRPEQLVAVNASEQTCVGDQEGFIPHTNRATRPGEKAACKRLKTTSFSSCLCSQPPPAVAGGNSSSISCGHLIPNIAAGNNLNLGERWG
jgi:hypothetical protein